MTIIGLPGQKLISKEKHVQGCLDFKCYLSPGVGVGVGSSSPTHRCRCQGMDSIELVLSRGVPVQVLFSTRRMSVGLFRRVWHHRIDVPINFLSLQEKGCCNYGYRYMYMPQYYEFSLVLKSKFYTVEIILLNPLSIARSKHQEKSFNVTECVKEGLLPVHLLVFQGFCCVNHLEYIKYSNIIISALI